MGGICLVVELAREESVTNKATRLVFEKYILVTNIFPQM